MWSAKPAACTAHLRARHTCVHGTPVCTAHLRARLLPRQGRRLASAARREAAPAGLLTLTLNLRPLTTRRFNENLQKSKERNGDLTLTFTCWLCSLSTCPRPTGRLIPFPFVTLPVCHASCVAQLLAEEIGPRPSHHPPGLVVTFPSANTCHFAAPVQKPMPPPTGLLAPSASR